LDRDQLHLRPARAGVVEHSVCVHLDIQGVGVALVNVLVSTEVAGVWTIQSGIFPEKSRQARPPQLRRIP
jgi:phosphinothricin acetyltransferase